MSCAICSVACESDLLVPFVLSVFITAMIAFSFAVIKSIYLFKEEPFEDEQEDKEDDEALLINSYSFVSSLSSSAASLASMSSESVCMAKLPLQISVQPLKASLEDLMFWSAQLPPMPAFDLYSIPEEEEELDFADLGRQFGARFTSVKQKTPTMDDIDWESLPYGERAKLHYSLTNNKPVDWTQVPLKQACFDSKDHPLETEVDYEQTEIKVSHLDETNKNDSPKKVKADFSKLARQPSFEMDCWRVESIFDVQPPDSINLLDDIEPFFKPDMKISKKKADKPNVPCRITPNEAVKHLFACNIL